MFFFAETNTLKALFFFFLLSQNGFLDVKLLHQNIWCLKRFCGLHIYIKSLFIYLAGSSMLWGLFSSCSEWGLPSSCGLLVAVASLVVEHGL